MMQQRVLSSGLVVLTLGTWSPVGAQPPSQSPAVERVDVSRVIIDVRVVDNDGMPIRGLRPADFDVRIGGKQVEVESAEWYGVAEPLDTPIASTSFTGVVEPEPNGQLIVFMVQKSMEGDRARGLLKLLQDSDRLLTQIAPDDRVAVVSFDSHLKIWQDFTDDIGRVEKVLTDDVMFGTPPSLEPQRGVSLLAELSQDAGRGTARFEDALQRLGWALETLPGSKSVVLVGYGFGDFTMSLGLVGARSNKRYEDASRALEAARATVFCIDITQADYHTFEHGLQTVADDTGGFYARTHLYARNAIDRVARVISGHYVLFTTRPNLDAGTHRIEVDLVERGATVLARRTYTN